MAKLTKRQRRILELLKERVAYKNASFNFTQEQLAAMHDVTGIGGGIVHADQIRQTTRLYRQSWIDPLIDALLSEDADRVKEAARGH